MQVLRLRRHIGGRRGPTGSPHAWRYAEPFNAWSADDNLYVVKFQNNPQHLRVLANELLATRLAEAVGLTVPVCEVIEVSSWLIANTPDLDMDLGRHREICRAGLQFGSRLVGGLMPGVVQEYLQDDALLEARNVKEFAGILALDKWTGNADGRQAVFTKKAREKRYSATFIDQGYCFNAGEWRFSDAPLRGVYGRNAVYREVTGWESFEPWLGRIETMAPEKIWKIAVQCRPSGGTAANSRPRSSADRTADRAKRSGAGIDRRISGNFAVAVSEVDEWRIENK